MISTKILSALCERHSVVLSSEVSEVPEFVVLAESLVLNASSVPEGFSCSRYETIPGVTCDDWYRAQRKDSLLRRIISLVEQVGKPNFRQTKLEPLQVKFS